MQNVGSAVIAAAGLGSRIGLGMPKCMMEIEGISILSRLLTALRPHVEAIHVVVGYREEMVIEYCARHHRDVVLVRNPEFRSTNTAESYHRGARHLSGKIVYLDGDLVVSPDSLADFLDQAGKQDVLVGVTEAKTENTVFVEGQCDGKAVRISGFTRERPCELEWANIVVGPSDMMREAKGFVFERLNELLPLNGYMIDLAEVDTPDDLAVAQSFVRRMESEIARFRQTGPTHAELSDGRKMT